MKETFLKCNHCGNIVEIIINAGVPLMCCGEKMTVLTANTSDGATEKHVPEISIDKNKVTVAVGAVPHPMLENHYIQWIYLKTNKGIQRKALSPSQEPKVEFILNDDEAVISVYEYCNLHGLWKKEV